MTRLARTRPSLASAACIALMSASSASAIPVINEFVANHDGADTAEFIEIFGAPSTDYSNLTVIEVEGEGASAGLIDDVIVTLGTTDANGFWWTGFDPGGSTDIENATLTLLLVDGFTGSTGNDIDTDNDGAIDAVFWTSIVDGVGVFDGTAGDFTYDVVLAAGFDGNSSIPGGASRLPNGVDTDSAGDWTRNDSGGFGLPGPPFDTDTLDPGTAANTPGVVNVPEPNVMALLLLGASLLRTLRRRG